MSIPFLEAIRTMFKYYTEKSSLIIKRRGCDMISLQETLDYIYNNISQFDE